VYVVSDAGAVIIAVADEGVVVDIILAVEIWTMWFIEYVVSDTPAFPLASFSVYEAIVDECLAAEDREHV